MAFIARIFIILALLSAPALAQVNEVEVLAQTIGSSPLDAQEKAIDYAKKRAFFLTLSKFAPDRANDIAKSLTTDQIYSLVRGYELMHERIDRDKPNHYLAQYKVSVSESMVKRLLSADSGGEAQEANPMLVLAVLHDEAGHLLLWEGANVWRSIWNGVALEAGEGILIVPYGDPNDQLELNAASVLSADYASLLAMIQRYGAGEAVIAEATLVKDKKPTGVALSLRRVGDGVNKSKQLFFETDGHSPTPESLLPMAAREAATQLKEIARTYQGNQLRRIANANKIALRAEFTRLPEWVSIKDKLEKLPRVLELRIGQIGIDHAQATLLYETTPEMMAEIMTASGLFLTQSPQGWTVRAP